MISFQIGMTSLMKAVIKGNDHRSTVDILLHHGADVMIKDKVMFEMNEVVVVGNS